MRHETPPGAVCLGSCPQVAAFLMGREHRRSRPIFLRFCAFLWLSSLNPGVLPADGDRRYLAAKARGEAVCECNFDRLALGKRQREGAAEA